MKRILALAFAVLLAPAVVVSGEMPVKYRVALSEGGAGLVRGLTFHAPFSDPANPLTVYKGSALTFTRAHDATHTATYIHPTMGLVTVADADQLRIEASGALAELAGVNLLTYSQVFSGWTLADGGSVTDDNVTAPDGNLTAAKLTDNNAAAGTQLRKAISVSAATSYAVSLFIRKTTGATTRPIFELYYTDTGGAAIYTQVAVNTNTGVLTANPSYPPDASGSESVGNYWRVWIARTSGASSTTGVWSLYPAAATLASPGYDGALTGTIYIWGAQMEAGVSASSYIPTVATTMTRNADALTFPTIASPGTAIAKVDGVLQEVTYATFDPVGHHTKEFREWSRTLSAAEIAAVVGP